MPVFAQPFVPGPTKQTRILLPEHISYRKVVLYKVRLRRGEPWYGCGGDGSRDPKYDNGPIRMPYNLNIDEATIDGMSIRKHIHLRMTGILERAYGQFVWQESDQMQSTVYIQEVPETEWDRDRDRVWRQFLRWEGNDG